jgi:predicted nuclease of predicted toxin-antitoxin system
MKIKLDENLPGRLAARLGALGHDVHTVREEGLEGHLDETIWEVAQTENRFLITQDLDFSDARRYAPGSHCGILLIRLRTPKRLALIRRIEEVFQQENVSQWERCLVLATESRVRVRRPVKLP